jgi:hypothetical protein
MDGHAVEGRFGTGIIEDDAAGAPRMLENIVLAAGMAVPRTSEQGSPVQAMPVARAAFLATRLSFDPVLRMTLFDFADLLPFLVLYFLRLAFFMNSSRFSRLVEFDSFLRSVARARD